MLIVGQRGRYDDAAHCNQMSPRQRDQSPHDGTILFRGEMQIFMSRRANKPSLNLEKVQKVLMGQQRAQETNDTCVLHECTRETTETCALRECTRHTGNALGNTGRRIGDVCATDIGLTLNCSHALLGKTGELATYAQQTHNKHSTICSQGAGATIFFQNLKKIIVMPGSLIMVHERIENHNPSNREHCRLISTSNGGSLCVHETASSDEFDVVVTEFCHTSSEFHVRQFRYE